MTWSTSDGRRLLLQRLVPLAGEPRDLVLATRELNRDGSRLWVRLRPFSFNALRGRALAGLPPALERLFIASTRMARSEAS